MTKINFLKTVTGGLMLTACMLLMTSCQKSFDANSYKPQKTYGGYAAARQVAATNLVAYWAFDNSYIDSVSKTVGTANHPGALSFVTGIKGSAVEVDSSGYINTNIANTIAGLQSFTYSCWLSHPSNFSAATYTYMPWSLNQAGFSWEQSKFFFLFNNADVSGKTYAKVGFMDNWFDQGQVWPALLDGKWHQIVVSYDGTSGAFRAYVDGALFTATKAFTFPTQTNFGTATSFTLGGPDDNAHAINGWMNSLNGDMDEFRIYSRELTPKEVNALYMLEINGL